MTASAKQLVKNMFPKYATYWHVGRILVENQHSYLHTSGWLRSLAEQKPVSEDGNALPWMNYAVIALLQERLNGRLDVFEFGSGYSTIFFAERVRSITSVEYDQAWFELIGKRVPTNAKIVFCANDVDGQYCRTIGTTGRQFDVVVVDGRDRVNCIRQSIASLTERGVIVLDDSQRERYQEGIDHAKSLGFSALPFEGIKPNGTELWRTTLLYRAGNCLGL